MDGVMRRKSFSVPSSNRRCIMGYKDKVDDVIDQLEKVCARGLEVCADIRDRLNVPDEEGEEQTKPE